MYEVLPRIFGEARLPYVINRDLISSSQQNYYREYENMSASVKEIDNTLDEYYRPVIMLNIEKDDEEVTYFLNIYQKTSKGQYIRTTPYVGYEWEIVVAVNERDLELSLIDNDDAKNTMIDQDYDIRFVYKLFKRRKSLININPLYALQKAKSHYEYLLSLPTNKIRTYIVLVQQCLALQKCTLDYDSRTTDFDTEIPRMEKIIEKWFAKKKKKLN